VIFALDEVDLPELDRHEGAGHGYDRVDDFLVRVVGSDEPARTITYLASPSSLNSDLEPYDWYLALVVAGGREHALPPEYVSNLEATRSKADPDLGRKTRLEALELLARC
jgi:hypothetical protein